MRELFLTRKREILSLRKLDNGWDGYQAIPVSKKNASYAIGILTEIYSENLPCPEAVAGVDGSIQLEWYDSSVEIELHIVAPNNILLWTNDPSICPDDEAIHITDSDITGVSSKIAELLKEGRATRWRA